MKCTICNENPSKYRCPKCLIRYCSLPCYKNHKENCNTSLNEPASTITATPPVDRLKDVECGGDSEDRVGQAALQKLGESEELLRMLGNPHLRAMMRHLDSASTGETEKHLEAAMKEPIFTEFVDQCLHVVEPQDPDT